jgi:hypothetical protein
MVLMDELLGRANLWYCRQCRPGTSALTITGPTAFANGVNLELLGYSGSGESERVFRTKFGGKTTML